MPILWVFETDVFVVQKGLFALSNVENGFFTIYICDLWLANTGGYKALQGVTRGYMGLQSVAGDYRRLQRVTRGYRALQGMTGGDKG